MNSPTPEASEIVAQQLGSQLVVLERSLASANRPGNLDGLFAHHLLQGIDVSFTWDVNPLNGPWLDQHADRLGDAPVLAALGYARTHSTRHGNDVAQTTLVNGLRNLMRRDPLPADGVTFMHDPRQLLGIALAAAAVEAELPQVREWLLEALADSRFRADGAHLELLRRHVRAMLTDQASILPDPASSGDLVDLALTHLMVTAGTARFVDPDTDLPRVQRRILTGLLRTDAGELSVGEAALLRSAAGRIIDSTMLSRNHVGVVLRRFPAAMKRWRWDDPADMKHPIRWEVSSEREVQDIVWILLRAVFDDLVDEEPLPQLGHSSYRSDFGLPHLGVLVEIKYVRSAGEFKHIEKQVFEDSVAYLRDRTTYKKIIVFIYDASSSVQEHDVTTSALLALEDVIDVVIVSRPSQLPPPGADLGGTSPAARRSRTKKAA
ncbi:hypothetical protein RB614_31630 [Phytohabitans sp. ZYX-F-186]|uniref:Uncharacterized protein n=1 Tax=Phytohabitans maris TaxID=3071409 RepID=A0ABU0ZQ51_9ACTN|nr:hypothetical protein [Phytohabitans sp. ZYX-F-186]MDQ7909083.1 hypothetical protein [Phytohabitans sp. ZYX-F-186]